MFTHEDDRRLLVEMQPGAFKVCKVVVTKTNSTLGDHHHRHKDERFLLIQGEARLVVIGEQMLTNVQAPAEFDVPRNTYHRFDLCEGAVLVGAVSEEFDASDEVAGWPE